MAEKVFSNQKNDCPQLSYRLHIVQESVMPTPRQVCHIVSVSVSLPLERDVEVSLMGIPILHEPHQPLQHVDYIKRNEKQFPHLRRMDPLMVDDISIDP